MPRSYPSFVKCAAPSDSHSYLTLGNIVVNLLGSLAFGGVAGGAFALITFAIGEAVKLGCAIGIGVFAFVIAGLHSFKAWYGTERLMCIDADREPDRCIVGTLGDDPEVSGFDGDRKMDMILAPFVFRDAVSANPADLSTLNCKDYFIAEIQSHPELFGPGPPNITDTSQLISYVDGLNETEQILLYMRVAHERMYNSSVPERHFQRHFQIRDRAQMGDAAFDNSPDDTFATSSPNPMFKMSNRPPLVPFLHCELEGNKWEKILDNIAVGLWTALAAFIAACIICMAFGLPEPACSLIGALASLLLGLLAWLLANAINDPDEGDAEQTDVDFEDPAFDGDHSTILAGDSLAIYGTWIKDEEHTQYFELHPIKAIYLVCNATGMGDFPWEVVDDLSDDYPRRERCPYPMDRVTAEDRDEICRLITDAEEDDPVILLHVPSTKALSTIAGLR
jgi:hypothetical protein